MLMRGTLLAVAALGLAMPVLARDHEYRTLAVEDGSELQYALVLPDGYDPRRTYPALLALPPGPQTREMVEAGLNLYWGRDAARHGWLVVSPVAPGGRLFFQGPERLIPPLLDRIQDEFKIEGGKFHLAGVSNGGRSAFRVALNWPGRFHTLTVLPGFPPAEEDFARLERLRGIPVHLFAGGEDRVWVRQETRTQQRLEQLGFDVTLEVFPGEGHVPSTMKGQVMDLLDTLRVPGPGGGEAAPGDEPAGGEPAGSIDAVLDDFHLAASEADARRYFAHFAPGAVFLGTDPEERWTLEQFRAYSEPIFAEGRGWTYHPRSRHHAVSRDGSVAWFDERLDNAKYGECRGSGVLVRVEGQWKIAQYNLSLVIPNDVTPQVVTLIRQEQAATE
ncbi:MAG: nuclear transport factor 2 family protein [Acidobacteriota bacterium]